MPARTGAEQYFDETRGRLAMWAAFLLPPLAWLLHLIVTFLLVYWARDTGTQPLVYLASGTALLLVTVGGYFAHRAWQRASRKDPGDEPDVGSVSRFMAFSWLVTSAVFALVIIVQTVPVLILVASR